MADINSGRIEMVDVEDPDYSSDDENVFDTIDSEYGEDSMHEQTLTPNIVTSKSFVAKSDFYRTSMKRQNICFGTSVFAVVGMFIAAYFYMDISFSPSNAGIFGDEKAMKGAAGEVGLDADNAETQQIIDQEIIELEETGHWGENAKDMRTKIDDIIFDKDRIGEHEWVTDSDWWKKNMENMNTYNMTKKELKAYKKMKKKAKRQKKKKGKDDKEKAKAAKKGKVPKAAKKEGHLEDIDDIKQKLSNRHHSSHGEGRDKHKDADIDDIYRIKQKHNGPRPDDWQRGKGKDEGDGTEEQQEPTEVPEAGDTPTEEDGILNKDGDDQKVQDDETEILDDSASEEGEIVAENNEQHEEEDEVNEELVEQEDQETTAEIPDVTRSYDESDVATTEESESVDDTEELHDVESLAENNEQLEDEEEVIEEDNEQEDQDITAEISEETRDYDSNEVPTEEGKSTDETKQQRDDSEELHEEEDYDEEEAEEEEDDDEEEEEKEEVESSEVLEDTNEHDDEDNVSEEETDVAENSEHLEDAEDVADANEEEESSSNTISTAYTVLEQDIHDKKSFTQGISYCSDGKIYETSGLYGKSKVRRINPDTFEVELSIDTPSEFFGEGSTCFIGRDGKEYLIEITWKEQKGFIYDVPSLELLHSFDYRTTAPSHQGWGITYDPNKNELIVSDGSEYLYFWDVENFSTQRKVAVTRFDGTRQDQINELEFMDGLVCYNIWHQDDIICADPETGKSVREYDFSGIWPADHRGSSENVLNGIALGKDHVLITGKRWDRIFKVDFTDWPTLFDNNN